MRARLGKAQGDRLTDAGPLAPVTSARVPSMQKDVAHRRSSIATMSMSVKSTLSPPWPQQKV